MKGFICPNDYLLKDLTMTIPTSAMSKTKLRALTKAALQRLYSPSTARRLWELHEIGVSVGTLARARKVLDGFGVTRENDKEWMFNPVIEWYRVEVGLRLYHAVSHTMIEVVAFKT